MKKRPRAGVLTVGQAAAVVGVSASTLRLWERAGLVAPARNTSRYRLYTPEELDVLTRIKSLRDVEQLNVAGIRQALGDRGRQPVASRPVTSLGPRLRTLRQRAGLHLAQAAPRAGVSASFLSAVERSLATASVATVQRLAAAYGRDVLELFDLPAQRNRLLGPGDRQVLQAHPGVRMELLSSGATHLESMLFRAAPRAGSSGAYAHEGEELVYVLAGSIEIWLDEFEHYLLRAGDSFWFESTRGHRWVNVSANEEAVLIWVCWRSGGAGHGRR
jgi:DNA-binding transcriptional MerR regulator/quercetin dioxygenase-like cupin family protein